MMLKQAFQFIVLSDYIEQTQFVDFVKRHQLTQPLNTVERRTCVKLYFKHLHVRKNVK